MKHPIPVVLTDSDRASLQTFIHAGKANARTFTRAHALLKAADGWTDQQICETFGISRNTSIVSLHTQTCKLASYGGN
ncbi:helix-turn-helix domain-containing protein [Ktedonobacter robiniae]|uniref:Uncharacterized protein n=1 Tax=Ktedonobacter robiniae TaxID=2778365 RepID=A0ABQ3UZK0_9CHLR|nr:helix-turn-helix domain-containing protein [Ktedonobacter robiniae]GHO57777.1 hypothetical protein KSB_62520 [Ktedonobacter robiniae]GHO60092.1 hypothetical protein KSB_85670 [Ktedonobacter robiniae]